MKPTDRVLKAVADFSPRHQALFTWYYEIWGQSNPTVSSVTELFLDDLTEVLKKVQEAYEGEGGEKDVKQKSGKQG